MKVKRFLVKTLRNVLLPSALFVLRVQHAYVPRANWKGQRDWVIGCYCDECEARREEAGAP